MNVLSYVILIGNILRIGILNFLFGCFHVVFVIRIFLTQDVVLLPFKKTLFPEWPPRWRRWRRGGGLGGGVRLPQVLTGAKTIIRWVPCIFGVGAIHTILFALWFVLFCKLVQILKPLYFLKSNAAYDLEIWDFEFTKQFQYKWKNLHNFDPTSFALICVFVLVLIVFVFCSSEK